MITTTHLFSYGGFVISWSSIKQIISATSSNHSRIIVLLWIQPATIFDIYYHYFNGHGALIRSSATNDPSRTVELPGLMVLKARDLPSVSDGSNKYGFVIPKLQEQFAGLEK